MYDHQEESELKNDLKQLSSKAGINRKNENPEFQHELQLKEKAANNTGLPDNLKTGIENLSGHSMDDVKVHYNSAKPAQLNAHAYAQGNQIHLASGQEKHLAHEAWHVVQQKQGRVKPTVNVNGANVNDDVSLEKEADVMGGKALQMKKKSPLKDSQVNGTAVQGYFMARDLTKKGNLPDEARVSDNMKIIISGKQDLYADNEHIQEANAVLSSESKIVLRPTGEVISPELKSKSDQNGMSTINFVDYNKVEPVYLKQDDQPKDAYQTVSGDDQDSAQALKGKHDLYISKLAKVLSDLNSLRYKLLSHNPETGTDDPLLVTGAMEWFVAINQWLAEDTFRKSLLFNSVALIAGDYVQSDGAIDRVERLSATSKALATFIGAEDQSVQSVVLPTDCGQVVTSITTGGQTKKNDSLSDNPEIGENYYVGLPQNASNQGWQYHWAGVVMKDTKDNITLESAGGTSFGNMGKSSWWFQMYGTMNVNQTFKKQTNLEHNRRNQAFTDTLPDGEEKTKANQQLADQRDEIAGWTQMDSDAQ